MLLVLVVLAEAMVQESVVLVVLESFMLWLTFSVEI
jgi:hypothetical protein